MTARVGKRIKGVLNHMDFLFFLLFISADLWLGLTMESP
jgi:hypothetical protein